MAKPAGASRSFERRLKLAITLLAVVVMVTLTALRGVDLLWRRERALAEGERRAGNLALILSEYLREAFESVDASLRNLAIYGRRIGGPEAASGEWMPVLASVKSGLSGVGSLSVTDAAGTIRHSTVPIVGQSRRGHYVFLRLSSDTRDVLVADTPFRTVTGSRSITIPLGRRLTTSGGAFDGMIVATFTPAQLRSFFQAVNVGARGVIWVFHPDGFVLFREPSAADPIGETAIGNPLFEDARRLTGPSSRRGRLSPDGADLISAMQPLEDPHLIVAVSLSAAEVLAEWRREVVISAAAIALLALLLAAGRVVLFRQVDARAVAEQALERAQRLEAVGRLTGGVAHDFNNLLTVILGNASLLQAEETDEERASPGRPLGQIEQAALRAADLTRSLLTFARRQPLNPQIVDLSELVGGLQPMLVRLLGEDVELRLRTSASPCLTNIDPVQAETALINLCVNARDAMPAGGLLVVETGTATFDEAYARLNVDVAAGRYVMLAVHDTGVGIRRDDMARIFEPFFTTKELGRGTGLGLSVVYGFVKQSGGHVKVYSEEGRGTAVKLYFPQATEPIAAGKAEERAAHVRGGAGETILLVEDEAGVRDLAARILRALGYRVIVATDGASALERARHEPRIDLLFTDVMLPGGMNGPQLASELTRRRPGLPVLYASGYSEEITTGRGQLQPGLRFLAKPYARKALAEAVGAALNEGPRLADAEAGQTSTRTKRSNDR